MRYNLASLGLALLGLLTLSGCQSNSVRETVDAPLLLNSEVWGLRDREEPFDGVTAHVSNRKSNKEGSYQAIEGEDLELNFYVSVMTRQGAFVREGGIGMKYDRRTKFVKTRLPDDAGWDVINHRGKTLGRLNKHLDPDPTGFSGDFGTTVYGGHARRNWSHIEGYETSKAIDPKNRICCWSFMSNVKLPFSEIKPTGDWGKVKIPMWLSVTYYDIAEQRYERAHRQFDLMIHFDPLEVE